jgi:seryl-tRNA synthetase
MIDSKILKENPESIKEMLFKRNIEFPLDELLNLDKKRRHLITELQNTNHNKNLIAKEIAAKRKIRQDTDNQIQEMSKIGEKIKTLEK